MEDGVDVALERFCRCARDAYKTDVQVEDIPDAQALHQQQRQTRQALDGLAERAWMVEARLQQLAVALDGGVLVTADGVEVELYGSGGSA